MENWPQLKSYPISTHSTEASPKALLTFAHFMFRNARGFLLLPWPILPIWIMFTVSANPQFSVRMCHPHPHPAPPQVFPVANPQFSSNAHYFDLCAAHHHHRSLCRLLYRSLETSSFIHLLDCSTKAKHKVIASKRITEKDVRQFGFYFWGIFGFRKRYTTYTPTREKLKNLTIWSGQPASPFSSWCPVFFAGCQCRSRIFLFVQRWNSWWSRWWSLFCWSHPSRAASSLRATWTQWKGSFFTQFAIPWWSSSPSSTRSSLRFETIKWSWWWPCLNKARGLSCEVTNELLYDFIINYGNWWQR